MPLIKNTNILFIWEIDKELKNHLTKTFSKEKNIKLVFPKVLEEKNILRLCKDADIIVGWRPSKEQLASAEKLKLYINPGTGIKHHINNFREINKLKEVILVNGHGHAYATAQHTVAMLLALMNKIIQNHNMMSDGVWSSSDDKDVSGSTIQLRNRKIGLLGYGAINKNVHRFLSGFENEFHILKRKKSSVIFTGIKSDSDTGKAIHYTTKDLDKFLKAIDILIIAIPHTVKTEGMIGKKELGLLGKNSLLVNVARGTIVNEESLYLALKNKTINGAALDVWYNYSPKKDSKGKQYPYDKKNPFHKLNNTILSPHRAASPFNDLSRWDEVIENIRRFSKGRKDYLNIVDLKEEY